MNDLILLTTDEAADRLRISARTLARMRNEGSGPKFYKIGARTMYAAQDLTDWVVARGFRSTAEASAHG